MSSKLNFVSIYLIYQDKVTSLIFCCKFRLTSIPTLSINLAKCCHRMESVCRQSAIKWGQVLNYVQSVSDNPAINRDKSLKMTYL